MSWGNKVEEGKCETSTESANPSKSHVTNHHPTAAESDGLLISLDIYYDL